MEALLPIIIQLVTGAAGGNIVGAIFKKLSLGTLGNTAAGVLGGGLGGQLLSGALGSGLVSEVASSAVGGGTVMVVIGLIKKLLAK